MFPLAMFGLGVPELLIILAVVLLLFGGSRLAGLGKSTGRALKEFKEETKGLAEKGDQPQVAGNETAAPAQTYTQPPVAQAPQPQSYQTPAAAPQPQGYQQSPQGYQQAPAQGYQQAPAQGYQAPAGPPPQQGYSEPQGYQQGYQQPQHHQQPAYDQPPTQHQQPQNHQLPQDHQQPQNYQEPVQNPDGSEIRKDV